MLCFFLSEGFAASDVIQALPSQVWKMFSNFKYFKETQKTIFNQELVRFYG